MAPQRNSHRHRQSLHIGGSNLRDEQHGRYQENIAYRSSDNVSVSSRSERSTVLAGARSRLQPGARDSESIITRSVRSTESTLTEKRARRALGVSLVIARSSSVLASHRFWLLKGSFKPARVPGVRYTVEDNGGQFIEASHAELQAVTKSDFLIVPDPQEASAPDLRHRLVSQTEPGLPDRTKYTLLLSEDLYTWISVGTRPTSCDQPHPLAADIGTPEYDGETAGRKIKPRSTVADKDFEKFAHMVSEMLQVDWRTKSCEAFKSEYNKKFGDRGGLSTSYMLRKYPGPFIEQCPGYARTRYAKRMQERNQSSGQQKRSKDNDLSSDTESDSNSDAATPPPLDARPLVTAAVSAPVLPHHSLRNNPAEVAPIESRKSESFTFVEGKPEMRTAVPAPSDNRGQSTENGQAILSSPDIGSREHPVPIGMTDERYSAVIDDYMTEVVEAHNRSTLRARQAHLDTELLPDKVSRIFLSGLDFYGKYMQRARQGLGDCLRYALSMSGNLEPLRRCDVFLLPIFIPGVLCVTAVYERWTDTIVLVSTVSQSGEGLRPVIRGIRQVLDTVVRDLKRVFQREEPNAAVDPNSAPLTISFLEFPIAPASVSAWATCLLVELIVRYGTNDTLSLLSRVSDDEHDEAQSSFWSTLLSEEGVANFARRICNQHRSGHMDAWPP